MRTTVNLLLLVMFASLAAIAQDTATLTGVVRDYQNQPVAGIAVRLVTISKTAEITDSTTNESGTFRFDRLAAARYILTSGASRLYEMDTSRLDFRSTIDVAPGETKNVDLFVISKTGVITGTVRDRDGDPVPNAEIETLQRSAVGHPAGWALTSSVRADDRGIYRIFNAPPGPTLVRIAHMARSYGAYGGVGYYGNTTDRTRARIVDVTPGSELRGIDIIMTPTKTYTIRGRLLDQESGLPITTTVLTVYLFEGDDIFSQQERESTNANGGNVKDGKFMLGSLSPGSYRVLVQSRSTVSSASNGTSQSAHVYRGLLTFNIDSADVTLDFPISADTKLIGSIRFEGATPSDARPSLFLTPAPPSDADQVSATAKPDGSFEMTGIYPIPYILNLSKAHAYIKSINGEPVNISRPIQLDFARDQHADIVLSTHTASVGGTLPGADAVAVWPADMNPWNRTAIRTVRPKADGTFLIEGLAPGKYFAAAWEFVPGLEASLPDPLYLHQFESAAIELADDSNIKAALKLGSRDAIRKALDNLR